VLLLNVLQPNALLPNVLMLHVLLPNALLPNVLMQTISNDMVK